MWLVFREAVTGHVLHGGAVILEHVTNGVAVRMAVLYLLGSAVGGAE